MRTLSALAALTACAFAAQPVDAKLFGKKQPPEDFTLTLPTPAPSPPASHRPPFHARAGSAALTLRAPLPAGVARVGKIELRRFQRRPRFGACCRWRLRFGDSRSRKKWESCSARICRSG